MKIAADRDVCIGAGMCVVAAPEVFDQDTKEGRVRLLTDRPGPEDIEAAREAVALCPSGALSLLDGSNEPPSDGRAP